MQTIDPVELGRCFDRHAAVLVLLARQWCSSPEDVVQESLLKLSIAKPVPDNPSAWLFRVVRNAAISAGRSERRRKGHEQRLCQMQSDWFIHDPSLKMDADKAVSVLQQLETDEREIIISHLWGGLTFEEIAQVVGSSSSSCHRIYARGLEQMRQSLGEIHACESK